MFQTSIKLPESIKNEIEKLSEGYYDGNISHFIRTACREHIKRLNARNVKEFVSELSKEEMRIMKEEIERAL